MILLYKDKFESVFGHYWDNAATGIGLGFFGLTIIHFIVGFETFIGLFINAISICKNSKYSCHFFFFVYPLMVALLELSNYLFSSKSSLDLSKDDLEKFQKIINLIEEKLNEVKRRILILTIYSAILVISPILHFLFSYLIKKNVNAPVPVQYPEGIINAPAPVQYPGGIINSQYYLVNSSN